MRQTILYVTFGASSFVSLVNLGEFGQFGQASLFGQIWSLDSLGRPCAPNHRIRNILVIIVRQTILYVTFGASLCGKPYYM